ncbi:MAG: hypothetical protein FWD13_08610 [Treponema sp.]|nr:hypothetical protein [Treponema sp.]
MKKIFAITLMTAILAGTAFAQPRLDGYFNSGLGFVFRETAADEDNDVRLRAFGVDSEQPGLRFRLNGSYQNEERTVGFRFRMQAQTTTASGYLSLPFAFGWVNFLDNKLSLNAGIIEDSTWTTGDWWLASDSVSDFAGLGTLLKITPIEGLTLGAGAYFIGRNGGSANDTLQTAGPLGTSVDIDNARYTVHAAYTMKDTFRVGGSFRTEGHVNSGASTTSMAYLDFRLLAIKDLTAVLSARFNRLEDFNADHATASGEMIFSETFAYKMDNLNIGLNAVQFINNAANMKDQPGLLLNIWGSYAFDNIIPRLDLVYFLNGRSNFTSAEGAYHRKGFTYTGTEGMSVFSIRPSVRINLDSRTHIEIGDMFNIDTTNAGSRLSNVFYVDLRWSF